MMSTWGNPLDQLKNEQRLQECLHYLQNNQTCTFNTRTGFSQQKLHKFNHESALNLSKREIKRTDKKACIEKYFSMSPETQWSRWTESKSHFPVLHSNLVNFRNQNRLRDWSFQFWSMFRNNCSYRTVSKTNSEIPCSFVPMSCTSPPRPTTYWPIKWWRCFECVTMLLSSSVPLKRSKSMTCFNISEQNWLEVKACCRNNKI